MLRPSLLSSLNLLLAGHPFGNFVGHRILDKSTDSKCSEYIYSEVMATIKGIISYYAGDDTTLLRCVCASNKKRYYTMKVVIRLTIYTHDVMLSVMVSILAIIIREQGIVYSLYWDCYAWSKLKRCIIAIMYSLHFANCYNNKKETTQLLMLTLHQISLTVNKIVYHESLWRVIVL